MPEWWDTHTNYQRVFDKDSWNPFVSFTKDYNHQLIFDNLDTFDHVYVKVFDHDSQIIIGLQETDYSGPADSKWEVVIGGLKHPVADPFTVHKIRYKLISSGSPGGAGEVEYFSGNRFGKLTLKNCLPIHISETILTN